MVNTFASFKFIHLKYVKVSNIFQNWEHTKIFQIFSNVRNYILKKCESIISNIDLYLVNVV